MPTRLVSPARNFTAYPEMPNARALVEYGVRVEELGYDSVWVWDHMLLGVEPNFPIIESLTALTGIAARTKRIKMGTGILGAAAAQRGRSRQATGRAWINCPTVV